MAAARPYFNLGIADLESIFDAATSDSAICQALIDELNHRNTERSATLFKRITAALREPQQSTASPPISTHIKEPVAADADLALLTDPASDQSIVRDIPQPIQHRNMPGLTNKPSAILAAWTALEALSPQTYRNPADLVGGDSRCVAPFKGEDLPWFRGERSRPNYRLYYQVVLGCIPVDRATDELIKTFGEDEERGRKEREKAALAAVLVDHQGFLVENNAVAVSSFGWALPIALSGDLAGLGAWPSAEQGLVRGLTEQLARTDEEGNRLAIDAPTLRKAFHWLVAALKLPNGLYEEPSFVLRVFHYFKLKSPPEVELLNSFFLADLARASKLVELDQSGPALARYLGTEKVAQEPNLLENHQLIEALIAPAKTPATRWPAPPEHFLTTLQQAAVNAARIELVGKGTGLVSVNGPPGTGKTTLLREVVVACVLDRALAMSRFKDPVTAFKTTGQKVAAGDRAFLHLYSLDESLKGHEVLVASSNNKAVENVSKELPALKAIAREFRYFKTVSDRLLSKLSEDGELVEGEPSWGLIAAVLGNALNRRAFQQALWWDDDRSLRLYLKAAKGDSVVREVKDSSGQIIRREIPTVFEVEAPPSPEEAKVNWVKARTRFIKLHAEVEGELRSLEAVRQNCLSLAPTRNALAAANEVLQVATVAKTEREEATFRAHAVHQSAEAAMVNAQQRERQGFVERPGWIHRFFNTKRMQRWYTAYRPLVAACAKTQQRVEEAVAIHERAKRLLEEAESTLQSALKKFAQTEATLFSLKKNIELHRQQLGERLVDEEFFQQRHEQWNKASPWLPDKLHRKREDLFAAALELHKAFIDVAAQKILHNLGVLMPAMQAGYFHDEEKKSLLSDLWSTLFLVCPVVSTTFASVDRMLGDLPPSSFGWVLVDEAGQATPQSAVGVLMRAKKAIIVGDPLQIPPVVSLPQRLVAKVATYFGITTEEWLAPAASVQTLADQASRFKAEFAADVGIREVGIPLLVHRRCQEPMFGISNRIAYDGQMVYATKPTDFGPVARTLGPSQWFDVDAPAESKWCPAEGEIVVQLLSKLAQTGVNQPDVYVITPFRIVAQELRRRIKAERGLLEQLGVTADEWLRDRVGTIHTFQGKEAAAVIAVLGAPAAAQQGSRRWAATTPNIFNVMVSRAKETLYVVGSRAAWSTVGYGKIVAAALKSA